MSSRAVLNLMGIQEPAQGMEIPLSYTAVGEEKPENKTFRLSGWFTSYALMSKTDGLLVSPAFAEKFPKSREQYLAADILFANEKRIAEGFERVKLDVGITEEQPVITASEFRKEEQAQIPMLLALCAVAAFFLLTGYLLIYNVLYISVSRDVRFYGLLKTLGTTPKQLKRLVVGQVLRLCLIGIPIGTAAAFLFSVVAVPAALNILNFVSTGAVVSFSPLIYLGAAAFALCTALLGAFLPAKKAAAVSPVEAQKFTGITRQRVYRPAHGKPYRMALRNIFRNRKRAVVVLLSLFLGITTFTVITTLVYSLGIDHYIASVYQNDFILSDNTLFDDFTAGHKTAPPFNDQFIEQITTLPGFEDASTQMKEYMRLDYSSEEFGEHAAKRLEKLYKDQAPFTEEELHEGFDGWLVGIDSKDLQKLQGADKGIDYSAYDRGELALIATDTPALYSHVSQLTITPSEQREDGRTVFGTSKFTVPLGGFAPQSLESDGALAPTVVVSQSFFARLYQNPAIREVWFDVADGQEKQALEGLEQICGDHPAIKRLSRIESASSFANVQMMMLVLGGGMALVIALIGILNFINVMSMDIRVRKLELATLESIGMEKTKVRRMLILEGLGYALITLLLTATLGNGIVYGVFRLLKQQVEYATFTYPILPMALVFLIIFAICVIVPEMAYRSITKTTVIERLREAE